MKVARFAVAASVALISCVSPVEETDSTVPQKCGLEAPLIEPQKTDILFVIDNSGSMAEEQEGVATELPAFIEALKQGGGVAQDFHVGVITTTVYQNAQVGSSLNLTEYASQSGRLQAVPLPAADGGVQPGTERMLTGDDPELIDKFRRLVRQGTSGSGQETPFEAVRLAVAGPLASTPVQEGGTQGFLRDGARLLVVVVSDEDDCSETDRPPKVFVGTQAGRDYCGEQSSNLTSVKTYFDAFNALTDSTGAPRDVIWAAIAPVSTVDKSAAPVNDNGTIRNVDCPTSFEPGIRHREMALLFDQQAQNLDSICNTSYRETLVNIAALANVNQTLEVKGLPDQGLVQVTVTRKDGTEQLCTVQNSGISVTGATAERPATINFEPSCLRRADDKAVSVKLLCAG